MSMEHVKDVLASMMIPPEPVARASRATSPPPPVPRFLQDYTRQQCISPLGLADAGWREEDAVRLLGEPDWFFGSGRPGWGRDRALLAEMSDEVLGERIDRRRRSWVMRELLITVPRGPLVPVCMMVLLDGLWWLGVCKTRHARQGELIEVMTSGKRRVQRIREVHGSWGDFSLLRLDLQREVSLGEWLAEWPDEEL